jgi:hypothetical protein
VLSAELSDQDADSVGLTVISFQATIEQSNLLANRAPLGTFDRDPSLNRKHDETLKQIYANPVRANINWKDVESMLAALGAELKEAEGSRLCVILNGRKAVYHRPHPQKETKTYVVRQLRDFLREAGIE